MATQFPGPQYTHRLRCISSHGLRQLQCPGVAQSSVVSKCAIWLQIKLSATVHHNSIGAVTVRCYGLRCHIDDAVPISCCRFQPPAAYMSQSCNSQVKSMKGLCLLANLEAKGAIAIGAKWVYHSNRPGRLQLLECMRVSPSEDGVDAHHLSRTGFLSFRP